MGGGQACSNRKRPFARLWLRLQSMFSYRGFEKYEKLQAIFLKNMTNAITVMPTCNSSASIQQERPRVGGVELSSTEKRSRLESECTTGASQYSVGVTAKGSVSTVASCQTELNKVTRLHTTVPVSHFPSCGGKLNKCYKSHLTRL